MAKVLSWKGQKRCINGEEGFQKKWGNNMYGYGGQGDFEKMNEKFNEFITCRGVPLDFHQK